MEKHVKIESFDGLQKSHQNNCVSWCSDKCALPQCKTKKLKKQRIPYFKFSKNPMKMAVALCEAIQIAKKMQKR